MLWNMSIRRVFLICNLLSVIFSVASIKYSAIGREGSDTGINITQTTNDTVRVEVNGKPFTEYYYKDVPRPYFYPVLGPESLPMTRNWPMKSPDNEEHDHPHHRSL